MRVLLACTRGAGHFNPLVPFARAAAARGHEVRFAGPPSLATAVATAGFAFEPFDDPPADELGAAWGRVPSLARDDANVVVIAEIFGRLNTTAALPRLLDVCARWRPDLVLRDPALFAAALAAEGCGIPVARVGIGLVATEQESLGIAAAALDAIRRDAGLAVGDGRWVVRRGGRRAGRRDAPARRRQRHGRVAAAAGRVLQRHRAPAVGRPGAGVSRRRTATSDCPCRARWPARSTTSRCCCR